MKDITIKLKINTKDIDFINKIIESYEGIALISTLNSTEGILVVHTSHSCYDDLMYILKTLPREYKILS
jgi:hypothetical protein